jgi:hypothetical protein
LLITICSTRKYYMLSMTEYEFGGKVTIFYFTTGRNAL